MLDIKLIALFLFVTHIEGQGLFGGRTNPIDRLPGVGACDRIAARGVGNCMENFLPQNILSTFTGRARGGSGGDICCSYSKYRACINGLHAGLQIAMQRERCPKSYSTQIIKSMGDSFVGLPLKSFCGNGGGGTKCPKSPATKPKKGQKPPKRTQTREEDDPIGLGGAFQPVRDIFDRGTGSSRRDSSDPSIFSPVRDVLNRGRDTLEQGASSVIGGIQNAFGGLGDFGRRNN